MLSYNYWLHIRNVNYQDLLGRSGTIPMNHLVPQTYHAKKRGRLSVWLAQFLHPQTVLR